MAEFTHLHVASCLSAHHGTAWPEDLVDAQASFGAPAAALTDRHGLYGAVRHIRSCLAAGVAPIVGTEILVDGCPVTILAHGQNGGLGWASLCRLISAAWSMDSAKHTPRHSARASQNPDSTVEQLRGLDPATEPVLRSAPARLAVRRETVGMMQSDSGSVRSILLGEDGPTCSVLLGAESDVGRAVLSGDHARARHLLRRWKNTLPGGIYLEIVVHYTRPGTPASLPHAADMLTLAQETHTPAVLTNAVRYLTPADVVAGDILDSAAQLLPLGEFPAQPNAQAWLKPPEMMTQIATEIARATDNPDAATQLLDTTATLAQRCVLDPDTDIGWRKPKVPSLAALGLDGDPQAILTAMCRAALPRRYPHPPNSQRHTLLTRLDDELATINQFGFATYFLTVADITTMIRQMGVRVQARGSGAGSLVNYVLGISSVDPITHDLLFERFLGGKRETLPDIDLDVESAERHNICRAIVKRFGTESVTLMATQNRYRARGAIRDAGAALGMADDEIDGIAKSLWRLNASNLIDALESRPELVEVAQRATTDPAIRRLFTVASLIDRLPRHVSLHPCGVIVSDEFLWSVTPTQPSSLGVAMSQYDKDDIDDMGLLKLDVLGVRMQSTIAHTLSEIERTTGEKIDLAQIPDDDVPTFDAIKSTHTLGMFQIESPGQRELVGKMQPDTMTDLIADISLFRPGPVKANMITPYVETKLGFTTTATLHPRFRGFLTDGRGVVIYHEHVLRILADCMGITLAEADALRRTMGKDPTIEQRFRDATARRRDERGRAVFTPRHIDKIWAALESFGSFGFCKAHACAFAVTTYESAWLKTHYPTQFMAGLLEHDPGMYPKRLLATEARRLGIPLLGVDVNHSSSHYHVEEVRDKNTSVPILSRTPSTCGIHPSPSFCGALRVALARSAAQAPRLAESRPHSPTSAVPGPCDFAQGDGLPDKEGTGRLTHGLRFPFTEIAGISDAQVNRLIANQPYCSIVDVIERARPSRPILIKLATIGAFDSLCPERTRGDIIAHTRHLAATTKHHEPAPGQDPLWDSGTVVPVPGVTYEGRKNWDKTVPSPTVPPTTGHSAERSDSQNPDSTVGQMGSLGPASRGACAAERASATRSAPQGDGERMHGDGEKVAQGDGDSGGRSHCHTVNDIVGAELEILGVDVSAHLLDPWREYLGELGVTPAGELIHQRGNASVLVAGVRVASGTPPTKTGQRVAFVSLDDGTGVADVAFFHDAQMETGPQLFRAQLMLVEGVTRRTGELGVSVTATRAWDLTTLTQTHTPLAINTGPSD